MRTVGHPDSGLRYRRVIQDEGEENYDEMEHQQSMVTSKGNVSASFRVPGLVTVPSGGRGAVCNVTIAQMRLVAQMSWVSVPKVDSGKVHLEVYLLCFFFVAL